MLSKTSTIIFNFKDNFYFLVNFNIFEYVLLIISKKQLENRGKRKREQT